MDSSSGASSSGATGVQDLIDQRRRKRMLSNRESARRSRQRKQRHLDELTAQAAQLRRENGHMLAALAATAQSFVAVESENAVLRTQLAELTARLRSLTDILFYLNTNERIDGGSGGSGIGSEPWINQINMNVALADMFQYC